MKNLDILPPIPTITSASNPDLKPAARLIILVPEFDSDSAFVARKIREVAKNLESRVQLISLSRDAIHEPGARRRLISLSALIEEPSIFVETKVEIGTSWLNAVLPHWHTGDVIICFEGQDSGIAGRPLHEILSSNLHANVYVISEVKLHLENKSRYLVSNILAWAGSLGLIAVFFLIQIRLVQPSQNPFQTMLLYASLTAEGGLIWIWNNIFNW